MHIGLCPSFPCRHPHLPQNQCLLWVRATTSLRKRVLVTVSSSGNCTLAVLLSSLTYAVGSRVFLASPPEFRGSLPPTSRWCLVELLSTSLASPLSPCRAMMGAPELTGYEVASYPEVGGFAYPAPLPAFFVTPTPIFTETDSWSSLQLCSGSKTEVRNILSQLVLALTPLNPQSQ